MIDLDHMPAVLLPEEVAELCRVSTKTVRRWAKCGRVRTLPMGRGESLRIVGDSVLALFGRARQQSHLQAWHEEDVDKGMRKGHNRSARGGVLNLTPVAGGGGSHD